MNLAETLSELTEQAKQDQLKREQEAHKARKAAEAAEFEKGCQAANEALPKIYQELHSAASQGFERYRFYIQCTDSYYRYKPKGFDEGYVRTVTDWARRQGFQKITSEAYSSRQSDEVPAEKGLYWYIDWSK